MEIFLFQCDLMTYDPSLHHRRSIRLKNYDYRESGYYFITVCVRNRAHLFGHISEDQMFLSESGEMVQRWFFELENKYPALKCDEFMCMPNHVHFILNLKPFVGADLGVRPYNVSNIVQWFKTMTTNEYMRQVKEKSWQPFSGKLWQRDCWERIIRGEKELYFIREYILSNPSQWNVDPLNFYTDTQGGQAGPSLS